MGLGARSVLKYIIILYRYCFLQVLNLLYNQGLALSSSSVMVAVILIGRFAYVVRGTRALARDVYVKLLWAYSLIGN